jgi:hypothetical protein
MARACLVPALRVAPNGGTAQRCIGFRYFCRENALAEGVSVDYM